MPTACEIGTCAQPAAFAVYWRYLAAGVELEVETPTLLCHRHVYPHRVGRTGGRGVDGKRTALSPRMVALEAASIT